MTKATLMRTAMLAAPLVMLWSPGPQPAWSAEPARTVVSNQVAHMYGDGVTRSVPLGVGKSVVIDLPRDVKDVLVADPKIANAVVRTARRAYLIGVAVGQTNVFFFDGDGRQIAGFDIAVTRDLNGMRAALKRMLPNSEITVEGIADGIMLGGSAANQGEAQQAYDLAARLAGDGGKVVNAIAVRGRDQVMLKVTVAEMQRDVIKQLGVNLTGTMNFGAAAINFTNVTPFPVQGAPLVTGNEITSAVRNINTTLRAMERAGVVRTLAEPTLTAISGESATFLAGGEFPVVSSVTCNPPGSNQCQPSVEFKKFGVSLAFTPIVLSEGRISLKVSTEVSELSSEGAIITAGITIPSLRVRRADTTLDIPSGGSLAMAGMIQEQTKQQLNGTPGMMNLPVLGALFKSRDYINRQTELVVLVTPYVVRPVAQKDLSRPDDGYADASDAAGTLLGRFNRLYGVPGKIEPKAGFRGNVGFILD